MAVFQVHGTLDVAIEGQILVLEGTGPWNMESLHASGTYAKPLMQRLYDRPWAVLAILRGEAVYVPDAARELIETVTFEKSRGRIATAIVLEDCDLPSFSRNHLSEIYQQAGERFEFFTNISRAKFWLEGQLSAS